MANQEDLFKNIISHSKEYGFIFQSSEIYDGLSAVYDYGQMGVELKKNLRDYWWKAMVQMHENIVGIDAAIFMHPTTWKASGHVDAFNDPLIDNKDSKKRYRADVLIEEHVAKIEAKIQKEVDKAKERFGESFNEETFRTTNARVLENQVKADAILSKFKDALEKNDLEAVRQIIIDCEIVCPISGTKNWTEVRQFNLMFSTKYGAVSNSEFVPTNKNQAALHQLFQLDKTSFITQQELKDKGFEINDINKEKHGDYILKEEVVGGSPFYFLSKESASDIIYLRPETAQGIFVNFLNVQKSGRMKIPFGIAQTGKAFRNEIVARQFIFRMREFEQMEMQYFVRPGTEMEWYNHWKATRMKWHNSLGFGAENYRFHDHLKLAHYANAACDIEFNFPFGFKELEGIHSRTDFDLKAHEQHSGKKLQYFDPEINQNYVPYVVETSVGLDRLFLAVMSKAYIEEKLPARTTDDIQSGGEDGTTRVVLNLPAFLAPIKVAVLPLLKKDGLPEKAREIMDVLKYDNACTYDEKDTIGKRYRRQDAIGTPFCVTIDHQSLEDNTVTIRHRDTMTQERVNIDALAKIIDDKVSFKKALQELK